MRPSLSSILVVGLLGCSDPGTAAPECDAIVAGLQGLPGAAITRVEGTFRDDIAGRYRTGCRVTVKGTFGALGDTERPEIRLAAALRSRGLVDDDRYAADGPDGTMFALRSNAVLCLVHGRWDGGDDSDPAYVPGDWYEVLADCAPEPPAPTGARNDR